MIPPLPVSARDEEPRPSATVPVPAMPEDGPHEALPPSQVDVPPFGEVDHPPSPSRPTEIPEMRTSRGASHAPDEAPAFTDKDLADALRPLLGDPRSDALALSSPEFEALIRSTIRRALSEHSSGPFDPPNFGHRTLWRFNALLTSRSYEDILHQKLHRFRVEDLLLFDHDHGSLISFASVKPTRHASARKASPFAHRVADRMRDSSGALNLEFVLDDGRTAYVRTGRFADLIAVIQGRPDPMVMSDLSYALKRIEERYQHEFESGLPLLHEIQPMLEECLLIHSPLPPLS